MERLEQLKENEVHRLQLNDADYEKMADQLTCEHLGNTFGDPHEHWCYETIYSAILFTLKKMTGEAVDG
tara:strand:- start:38 stop:244 length:207 start_codon:yes stop_codon:yes gene_type:complete